LNLTDRYQPETDVGYGSGSERLANAQIDLFPVFFRDFATGNRFSGIHPFLCHLVPVNLDLSRLYAFEYLNPHHYGVFSQRGKAVASNGNQAIANDPKKIAATAGNTERAT